MTKVSTETDDGPLVNIPKHDSAVAAATTGGGGRGRGNDEIGQKQSHNARGVGEESIGNSTKITRVRMASLIATMVLILIAGNMEGFSRGSDSFLASINGATSIFVDPTLESRTVLVEFPQRVDRSSVNVSLIHTTGIISQKQMRQESSMSGADVTISNMHNDTTRNATQRLHLYDHPGSSALYNTSKKDDKALDTSSVVGSAHLVSKAKVTASINANKTTPPSVVKSDPIVEEQSVKVDFKSSTTTTPAVVASAHNKVIFENSTRNGIETTLLLEALNKVNRTNLPQWYLDYTEWHNSVVSNLTMQNYLEHKYLILRCSQRDMKCGGTSDRLHLFPFFLRMAYNFNRIFFIRWGRPCRIEEFLQPAGQGYINWTVPSWLQEGILEGGNLTRWTVPSLQYCDGGNKLIESMRDAERSATFVEGKDQGPSHGEAYYRELHDASIFRLPPDPRYSDEHNLTNVNLTDISYEPVYHDMFRSMFQPSQAVGELIDKQLSQHGLLPGNYSVAHYRAYYLYESDKSQLKFSEIQKLTSNAVNCAYSLMPNHPVYFASDSKRANAFAIEYGHVHNVTVVVKEETGEESLHLDLGTREQFFGDNSTSNWGPSKYHDTFVDLLMMANGRCITYGNGGFGTWARILSHDPQCSVKHSKRKDPMVRCPAPSEVREAMTTTRR